jgi:hypothetical protein
MSGSILPTITHNKVNAALYALAGSGGGGTVSTFNTATINSLTVSTIVSPAIVTNGGNAVTVISDQANRSVFNYQINGQNKGFIQALSSIKGADGAQDSAGGVEISGGDSSASLTVGGTSPDNGVVSVGLGISQVNFLNTPSTIVSNLNATSITTNSIALSGGQQIPFTSARGMSNDASPSVGTPANMGFNFNTTVGNLYNLTYNVEFTSNSFIGTTSPDPVLVCGGIAGQNAYSQGFTKSYVSTLVAETGSPTLPQPVSFTFKASAPINTDVFAFLFDTNVSASGGFNIVGSQGYLTDYGAQ